MILGIIVFSLFFFDFLLLDNIVHFASDILRWDYFANLLILINFKLNFKFKTIKWIIIYGCDFEILIKGNYNLTVYNQFFNINKFEKTELSLALINFTKNEFDNAQ